jgi:hypothetical protein
MTSEADDDWTRRSAERRALVRQFALAKYLGPQVDRVLALWGSDEVSADEDEFLDGLADVLEAVRQQSKTDKAGGDPADVDGVDSVYFKEQVLPNVIRCYLAAPNVQSPNAAAFLAAVALDTEIYPLKREAKDPTLIRTGNSHVDAGVAQLSQASTWIYSVGFVVQLGVALVAYLLDWFIISIGIFLYTIYGITIFGWRRHRGRRALLEFGLNLSGIASRLELIKRELSSRTYNAEAIVRRLKALEAEGAYIPSYVFSLLEDGKKLSS